MRIFLVTVPTKDYNRHEPPQKIDFVFIESNFELALAVQIPYKPKREPRCRLLQRGSCEV